MFKPGDWRCGECRKFAGASRVYKTLVYPGALLWDGLPSGEMFKYGADLDTIDMQCIVWNTWGPIESGAQYAFDWSESTVAMFANWGTVMFLLSVVPLSKMVEVMYTVLSTVQ